MIGNYIEIKEKWFVFLDQYKDYIKADTILMERFYDDPAITKRDGCLCDLCMTTDNLCGLNFEAVRNNSDMETATEIIYGQDGSAKSENNADWVKSTMQRLENKFDQETTKQIRMCCQCGYGMDEKLAFARSE